MLKIKVVGGVLRLGQGVAVGLSEDQLKSRLHAVTKRGGAFVAKQTLEFKTGEMLSVENLDAIPKNMREVIEADDDLVADGAPAKVIAKGGKKAA